MMKVLLTVQLIQPNGNYNMFFQHPHVTCMFGSDLTIFVHNTATNNSIIRYSKSIHHKQKISRNMMQLQKHYPRITNTTI
jgi:hypothetical protein